MHHILSLIHIYAALYQVDPRLVYSVMKVESDFNPNAHSDKGAIGLLQVMPSSVSIDPSLLYNPRINVREGVRYMAQMQRLCPHRDNYEWVVCYYTGVAGSRRVKDFKNHFYYKAVMETYRHAQDLTL